MDTQGIIDRVRNYMDGEVRDLSREEYREVLEEISADIECRLNCLDEEENH